MKIKQFLFYVVTDQVDGIFIKILKFILWLFSLVYEFLAIFVCWLYKKGVLRVNRLDSKVVSVGNITLGGVGKTPLVELISRRFKDIGKKSVILSRGYKDSLSKDETQIADEARMLKNSLGDVPVVVGPNRFENATKYLKNNEVDIFVVDDGFQRWRLFRDLDIVCIDATNPWGNGFLLPRGILRENINSLKRAGMFVITKSDFGENNVNNIVEKLRNVNSEAIIVKAVHSPKEFVDLRSKEVYSLEYIQGKKIHAFCGIGDPKSFVLMISKLGADIVCTENFIDHHVYVDQELLNISNRMLAEEVPIVVTTQKDAVKIKEMLDMFDKNIQVLALNIGFQFIEGKEQFLERIDNIFMS